MSKRYWVRLASDTREYWDTLCPDDTTLAMSDRRRTLHGWDRAEYDKDTAEQRGEALLEQYQHLRTYEVVEIPDDA